MAVDLKNRRRKNLRVNLGKKSGIQVNLAAKRNVFQVKDTLMPRLSRSISLQKTILIVKPVQVKWSIPGCTK